MTQPPDVLGTHVDYMKLNSKQQEIFNFQKVAARLADYGYACIKLSDDWKGADFLADHFSAERTLRVQLKSCLTIDKKYIDRNIHMTFPIHGTWYLIQHEELVELVMQNTNVANTKSWKEKGLSFNFAPNANLIAALEPFMLVPPADPDPVQTEKGVKSGPVLVRVGREIVGPMAQNRAALTAISAAADLTTVDVEELRKLVGNAALRPVAGTYTGHGLWNELCREYGLETTNKAQWFVDNPVFRDGQTWVVQSNVWSRAKLEKLAAGLKNLTPGDVEILLTD